MTRTLQAKDAVEIIEAAFAPLRCVAESLDHDDHISFSVFDASDSPLLSVEKILVPQFTDPQGLTFIINEVRSRSELANCGVDLEPWQLPKSE